MLAAPARVDQLEAQVRELTASLEVLRRTQDAALDEIRAAVNGAVDDLAARRRDADG